VRKLIESTFVTLGGDIGAPQDWGPPYLFTPEIGDYARELLFGADALLLGRKTYQGLSAGYLAMAQGEGGPANDFVARMNAIPKYVASTTLTELSWNATLLAGDVARQVAELKDQPGNYLLKYGTGPLDRTLIAHGLVDEFRIWIVPVTHGPGQSLFTDLPETSLELAGTRTFSTGVVLLTYVPAAAASAGAKSTGAGSATAVPSATGRRAAEP
jgi:dihydrofolate reductase